MQNGELARSTQRLIAMLRPENVGTAAQTAMTWFKPPPISSNVIKPIRFPRFPATLGRIGSLEVRLAQEKRDVKRAQKLRYRVFYKDGTAIADATTMLARRDKDAFDKICDHLLVIDHAAKPSISGKQPVVGTYRLLRQLRGHRPRPAGITVVVSASLRASPGSLARGCASFTPCRDEPDGKGCDQSEGSTSRAAASDQGIFAAWRLYRRWRGDRSSIRHHGRADRDAGLGDQCALHRAFWRRCVTTCGIARRALSLIHEFGIAGSACSAPPLPWGEVGLPRRCEASSGAIRVRGNGPTIDRNPSPRPSPFGRGSALPLPRHRPMLQCKSVRI